MSVTCEIGYAISGWIVDGTKLISSSATYNFTNITSPHSIGVIISAKSDTQYIINHYHQVIDDDNAIQIGEKYYAVFERQMLLGTTNEITCAVANEYEGFSPLEFEQSQILGDGTTIINILYDRNSYTLSLEKGSGVSEISGSGTYLYGQSVSILATLEERKNFSSWISDNQNFENINQAQAEFCMPAFNLKLVATCFDQIYEVHVYSNDDTKGNVIFNEAVSGITKGATRSFRVVPASGYEVESVFINGVRAMSVGDLFEVRDIEDNIDIEVNYVKVNNAQLNNSDLDTQNSNTKLTDEERETLQYWLMVGSFGLNVFFFLVIIILAFRKR